MITIDLFYYCKKVFIVTNISMIWKISFKTSLLEKEHFYSHFNMEGSTDADYVYLKKFCKDIEMKNLGEYYYLYVQNDTLLLVDVFENFRNMFLKIYPLDLGKFLSVPGLEWQAVSKN